MNVNVIKKVAKQLAMSVPVLVPGLLLVLSPALMADTYRTLEADTYALKADTYALKADPYALKADPYALKADPYALKAPITLMTPAHARVKEAKEITIILAQASISEGQAASMAKSKYGGKVLSVSKSGSGGRVIYRVKLLLDSGRVIIVTVDGQTGRVSG